MDATAHVRPDGRTHYVAEISGRLPVFWAGNLLAALAARNIDVVSGRGSGENRRWSATLVLDARRAATPPDQLDLIELASTDAAPAPNNGVRLSRFELKPLADGRLDVRVFAPDQSGFLSRLLRSMALVGAYLREFEIDTPGGHIQDRFVLGGPGGPVSSACRRAFEGILRGYTG